MTKRSVKSLAAAAGVLSSLCLVAFFLALHDIRRDYVSAQVLQDHVAVPPALPAWTACAPEWRTLSVCIWPIAVFHITALIALLVQKPGPR